MKRLENLIQKRREEIQREELHQRRISQERLNAENERKQRIRSNLFGFMGLGLGIGVIGGFFGGGLLGFIYGCGMFHWNGSGKPPFFWTLDYVGDFAIGGFQYLSIAGLIIGLFIGFIHHDS